MSQIAENFTRSDPDIALQLSQQAQLLLSKTVPSGSPLSILYPSSSETPQTWTDLERLFHACLRTGDDRSAHLALQRLTQRFGADNERVMGLRGLYQEAEANSDEDLGKIVLEYNKILSENPMNIPIHKRRIALLRSMKEEQAATSALVDFLDSFPSDGEAWCELADLYFAQGMSSQAIFCLEEALLNAPNAWNLHARLGELEYLAGLSSNEGSDAVLRLLNQSVRRFCRSIELCDDYLRGYYGLHLATKRLLSTGSFSKSNSTDNLSRDKTQRLHDKATRKLSAIVEKWSNQQLPAANQSEIIAAKVLLDRAKS